MFKTNQSIQEITNSIAKDGIFFANNFFNTEFCNTLRASFQKKELKDAGIGSEKETNKSIRTDKIAWLEKDESDQSIQNYFTFIDEIKKSMRQELFLNVDDFESHFAFYEKGGFYKKHLDNIQGKNNRVLTCITYLNKDWQDGDGGELCYYLNGYKGIVKPKDGTFLCFLSSKIEHEVLESKKDRLSITGWLKRKTVF